MKWIFCVSFLCFAVGISAEIEFCGGESFVFKPCFRGLGVFTCFDKVLDGKLRLDFVKQFYWCPKAEKKNFYIRSLCFVEF